MTIRELTAAQNRLKAKLLNLNIDEIQISDYTKEYLKALLNDIDETLGRFTQVIQKGMIGTQKPINSVTILDFGGGSGLLSLLAIEAGAKEVIYNDIYQGSCDDVIEIARHCNLKLETIICGDHEVVVTEFNRTDKAVDLILSYDVIEHVYNVSEMFRIFQELNNPPQFLVFGSGANIKNPFYVSHVKKIQNSVEFNTRQSYVGHKERDSLESYFNLRKKLIKSQNLSFTEIEIDFLASNSRGLIESDIKKLVEFYTENKTINYSPNHPTNTCDPLTGNWCEQLFNHDELIQLASKNGQRVCIEKGRYTVERLNIRGLKRLVMNLLNSLLFNQGYFVAPFYILILEPHK